MNDHDPMTGRPRSRALWVALAAVLTTGMCVAAVIPVRMPLLLPVVTAMFGALGLVVGWRARMRYGVALARLERDHAPDPHLVRIGDAERDQVTVALHDHFAAGRLDRVELEERLTVALAAKTGAELAPLLADLPQRGRRPR